MKKKINILAVLLGVMPVIFFIGTQMFNLFSKDISHKDIDMYSTYFMLLRQNIVPQAHEYFYIHKIENEPHMMLAFTGNIISIKTLLEKNKYFYKGLLMHRDYNEPYIVYESKYNTFIGITQEGERIDLFVDLEKSYDK